MVARPFPISLPSSAQSRNRLLAALPREDYRRLLPRLETVPMKVKAVLQPQGQAVRDVYFPGRGMCSVMAVMHDGAMVEVATVGREGPVGLPAVLGRLVASAEVMVQIAGEGQRMPIDVFSAEMDRRGTFSDLVARCEEMFVATVMQSVACNALHAVEHRLARWILTTRDRIENDELALTQDLLAVMLGVRRPTVTIIAGTLQKAGLINLRHGRIQVIKPLELEAASCECYAKLRDEFGRLLPELATPSL